MTLKRDGLGLVRRFENVCLDGCTNLNLRLQSDRAKIKGLCTRCSIPSYTRKTSEQTKKEREHCIKTHALEIESP